MKRSNRKVNFEKIELLQHLNPRIIHALENQATVYRLDNQEALYYQGEAAQYFYVVQSGGVRLMEYTTSGQAVNLKIYSEGDIFGLLAVSGSYPHPSQVEAIMASEIAAISGKNMRRLMELYPQLAITVVDLLVAHVHRAHERIRVMAAERVDRRLARALLLLCDKFGKCGHEDDSQIYIDVSLSQQDIAEFTGATVETINRTLRQWESQDIVRSSRKRIDVLNREALEDIAEDRIRTADITIQATSADIPCRLKD